MPDIAPHQPNIAHLVLNSSPHVNCAETASFLASMDTNPPSRRTELIAVQVSMTAVALLIVALRLISRYMILESPGWDDYAITAAMVALALAPGFGNC